MDSLAKQVASATGRPIDSSGYDLLAVGQPNAGNDYPVVTVTFQSGLSGTSPSMQEIVDSILNQFKATYAVSNTASVSSTQDRAEVVVSFSWGGVANRKAVSRIVFLKGSSWLCMVIYNYDSPEDSSLDAVFGQSAKTIVVKAQ